jgi:hypothetical protein
LRLTPSAFTPFLPGYDPVAILFVVVITNTFTLKWQFRRSPTHPNRPTKARQQDAEKNPA